MSLLFQSAVATAKGKIMLNLPTQHKLGVLQWLVIQQPVQFCSLYWGIAVFVLDGDAVDVQQSVTKYIVPLFAAMVVALFLVTFIPAIALVVPYLCGLVPSLGWTM